MSQATRQGALTLTRGHQHHRPPKTPRRPTFRASDYQTDIVHVIKGVIEAETGAIDHFNRIIESTDGLDWVTQDMVISILRDEERHRRLFEGYLREYRAEGLT